MTFIRGLATGAVMIYAMTVCVCTPFVCQFERVYAFVCTSAPRTKKKSHVVSYAPMGVFCVHVREFGRLYACFLFAVARFRLYACFLFAVARFADATRSACADVARRMFGLCRAVPVP